MAALAVITGLNTIGCSMSDLGELFDSAKRASLNMALSDKDEIAIKLMLIHIIDRTGGRCREETGKLLLELISK